MANETLNFTININGNAFNVVADLGTSVENMTAQVQTASDWFDRLGNSALKFDAITNVIDKFSQGFQTLVGSSLDYEQTQSNFRTMMNGNAEAADNLLGKLREYGKNTVYGMSGLAEAQKTMMAFGLDSEYAYEKLEQIGDIALGDNQKMQSLSLAFAQMSSTGKLMGQDLLQMINAGFNPLEVISQKTEKSIGQLKEEMSKGAISAEMVAQAFEWATEEGGRFYQGAENAADTVSGKIAKMQDTIDEWKLSLFEATGGATAYIAEIGKMVVPLGQLFPIFNGVGKSIKWCTANFHLFTGAVSKGALKVAAGVKWMQRSWSSFVNSTRTGVVKVALNLSLLHGAVMATGGYFKLMSTIAKTACRAIGVAIKSIPIVGWIAAAISAIIAVITVLWKKSEGFRRLVFGVWESIKAVFHNIGVALSVIWESGIKPVITKIVDHFRAKIALIVTTFNFVKEKVVGVFFAIGEFFANVWNRLTEVVQKVIDGIVTAFLWVREKVVAIFTAVGEFFVNVWNWVSETFHKAINFIAEKLSIVGVWIKTKLVQPIKDAFSSLWNIVKSVFDKILSALGRVFEPIRTLWNKIFKNDQMKSIKVAYQEGAEKGSDSYNRSKKNDDGEDDNATPTGDTSANNPEPTGNILGGDKPPAAIIPPTNNDLKWGSLGEQAGTSAGKAQQINITLKSMVETMNFNGGIRENREDVEGTLAEMMARILGMAETAA